MEFRSYRNGDESQLVALFNLCFPGGIMRTTDSWRWRFMNNPNFDPEGVIIAEEKGEIRGYVIAVPRKPHFYKGRKIRIVHGDDLCVLPEARGAGLGTRLIKSLMNYAEERQALLLGYVGKESTAHKIEATLGWSAVDEYLYLRRVATTNVVPGTRTVRQSNLTSYKTLSKKNVDAVIDFLNSWNSKKIPSPIFDRSEYEWRYLTHENCNSDSIYLAEEGENIVGHIAVSSHPTSTSQEPFVILSEPCGEIQGILHLVNEIGCSSLNVVTRSQDRGLYEALGFSLAGTNLVHVKDYTGSNVLQEKGAGWYLFPESIFGAP